VAIPALLGAVASASSPAAVRPPAAGTTGAGQGAGSDFAGKLGDLIDGVERTSAEANSAVSGMLTKSVDVHEAMIALQRAELSLQLTVQVRNKLVQAYQDVMRMPI
jgi:flagellar hook-basal body complex protein FliE